jgi:hypothetical protein
MDQPSNDMFYRMIENFITYVPSLFAGLLLIGLGWLLGWFAKGVIIRLGSALRLERVLVRYRWGRDFSKADVRHGLYDFFGNIAFSLIFLLFLDNALNVWQLTMLAQLLERGILFLPKLIIALLLFGVGWLIAAAAARAVQQALYREDVPKATLIARFSKSVLILFFSAMALTELGIGREIVIIGFATIFITLGALTVVVSIVTGKKMIAKMFEGRQDEK